MFFKAKQVHSDYEQLICHMVEMNNKQSSREIIDEAETCLNNFFGCRLFVFALKKKNEIAVWVDPRMYKKSFEDILLKQIGTRDIVKLTLQKHNFNHGLGKGIPDIKDLACYQRQHKECHSTIYMVKGQRNKTHYDGRVDLILRGCAFALSRHLEIEKLTQAAVIDQLTGCYNRRGFETQLKRTIAGSTRHYADMSVFIFDLDEFKTINDTYGHPAGDRVLQEVASLVQKSIRTDDILTRYGGDEFVVILPETNKTKAIRLADRLRIKLSNTPIVHDGHAIHVTATFGVAQWKRNTEMSWIIQEADNMLYQAKLKGRNIVMPALMKILSIDSSRQVFRPATIK